MAITPYATVDDLGAYLGTEVAADSQRLLARAQELVDAAMTSAMYGTDAAGENPTDAKVITALKLATCAQVEFWQANGDELDEMGQWTMYTLGGVSVSRQISARGRRYRLCDRSWDILRAAKLLPGTVFST